MDRSTTRENAKNRVIAAGNAQAVFNRLNEIETDRPANLHRWIWELLQNARDAAGAHAKVSVTVSFKRAKLTFQHDGPPFRDDEIAHLIFHGSTKHDERTGIGRFGTGFISTHLLSRIVGISGPLDDGNVFDFKLDRTGVDAKALELSMGSSWDAMNASLRLKEANDADGLTSFVYPIGTETEPVVIDGLERLSEVAPLILAFNPQFISLTIDLRGSSRIYRAQQREPLSDGLCQLTVVDESGQEAGTVLLSEQDGVSVAIANVGSRDGAVVLPGPHMSRIYVAFPLSGTAGYPFRAAVNSEGFHPRTERDGLYLDTDVSTKNSENRARIERACDCFCPLMGHVAEQRFTNHTSLLVLTLPVGLESVKAEWLKETVRTRVVNDLLDRQVLLTHDDGLIAPRQAVIPFAEVDKRESLWQSFAALKEIRPGLCRKTDVDGWNEVITSWSHFLGEAAERLDGVWTLENLVTYAAERDTLDALADVIEGDVWEWLDGLLDLLQADASLYFTETYAILPNQFGALKCSYELSVDKDVPLELKEIAESLKLSGRAGLLAAELTDCDYADELETQSSEDFLHAILEHIGEGSKETQQSAIQLFSFVARNKLRHWLERIPIVTAGEAFNTSWIKLGTSPRDQLLMPVGRWNESNRVFGELFPASVVLHDDYAVQLPDDADWKWLVEQAAVIAFPLVRDSAHVEDFVDGMRKGSEREAGRSKGKVERSHLAHLASDESILERVRNSRRLGILLVQFLVQAVVPADVGAFVEQEVEFEDDEKRRCYGAAWLAPLLNRGWVKNDKRANYLTAESLAGLLVEEPTIVKQLLEEGNASLLKSFGISPSDLALRTVGKTEDDRMSLIRSLGVIADAVGHDPALVARFAATIQSDSGLLEYIEQRSAFIERMERNQTFGFAVEREFTNSFGLETGVSITRTGRGHDFILAVVAGEEDDAGRIEVSVAGRTVYVELKATCGSEAVRMSVRQVEAATSMPDRYWLCVVVIEEGAVTSEAVQSKARFVCDIGTNLEEAWEKYGELREATPPPSASESEAALEVTDQEVKFRIGSKLWEKGVTFAEAINRLKADIALSD